MHGDQNFCILCGAPLQASDAEKINFSGEGGMGTRPENIYDSGVVNSVSYSQLVQEGTVDDEEQKRIEAEREEREIAREYFKKYNTLSDNYFVGFVGAMLGGLVGAIPWAIVSNMGWFVAWLGGVIALAASKGYDLVNVKMSMKKIWFVAIAVVNGVFAGQIMSDLISFALDEELAGMFAFAVAYYFENIGEMISINSENLFLGLFFAALGGFGVLRNIRKEMKIINILKEKYPEETGV